MEEKPRVVVDTNIFVSALLGSESCRGIYELFVSGEVALCMSEDLFAEIEEVLKHDKFTRYFSHSEYVELLHLLQLDTDRVTVNRRINVCRDDKDNMILECAVAGNVDYVVTGDKDLLTLDPFHGIRIITPTQFLTTFR